MFADFQEAIIKQFETMKDKQLFRTDVEKEMLWLTYLESFPEGSNPMFRERTEHDCQCCKSFIRAVGSMVTIDSNLELISIWDCDVEEPYKTVAKAMSELVKDAPIKNVLLHESRDVGKKASYEELTSGKVLTWNHFYVQLPREYVSQSRGTIYGEKRDTATLFRRSLDEISQSSAETVLELIGQNSLYRGEEHAHSVEKFIKYKKQFEGLKQKESVTEHQLDRYCWNQNIPGSVTKIKNSVIGTLLVDITEGESLNDAVKKYESKVAPANYKRPKALFTKAMIDKARKTLEELGLTSALGRRFAVAEDITVNNVLFANRDARKAMNADVFDEMISEVKPDKKKFDRVEEVQISQFVEKILPKAESLEVLFERRHVGNLVNLVAPKDSESKGLFQWDNNFSWCYNGDVADSIRARVKQAGGSVTGDFRASLAWFNSDDLDLHLIEPNRHEIFYGDKKSAVSRGELDVDMNVYSSGPNFSRNAVENITYPHRQFMMPGEYKLFVHNYSHREYKDVGFEVEVEFMGDTYLFTYPKEVRHDEKVLVATFEYSHESGIRFLKSIGGDRPSKEFWNIKTEVFQPVTMVMYSPNHWNGGKTGNKHFFFMLQDCKREGSSRGFFNEYLSSSLREYRKVFEVLGSKMRTEDEGDQLSGLGFSSTVRNNVLCKVSGSFNRTVRVMF